MNALAPRRIAVCLLPRASLESALLACEPLRSVNRFCAEPVYDIAFVGPGPEPVASGIGIEVAPDATYADDRAYDLVVVVAAYDLDAAAKRPFFRWLRRQARGGAALCGVDYGALLLAEAGLLTGYRATLHWEMMGSMVERFPDVDVCDEVYVIDRDRLSCGGHVSCADLFIAVIERDLGARMARIVAADIIYGSFRTAGTRQNNYLSSDPIVTNRHLREAVAIMEANIETPLTVPEVAAAVGLSVRQLQSLSLRYLGQTPSGRYLDIRLNAARHMLMYSDLSITEIVPATGFASPSAFSRAFRKRFGTTARAYRRAFALSQARPYFGPEHPPGQGRAVPK